MPMMFLLAYSAMLVGEIAILVTWLGARQFIYTYFIVEGYVHENIPFAWEVIRYDIILSLFALVLAPLLWYWFAIRVLALLPFPFTP